LLIRNNFGRGLDEMCFHNNKPRLRSANSENTRAWEARG
jgi:hypothetical protein